tara:strand:+ start:2198 stop:2725 length:528 start_codon:yes stop_codon:yes gene_type:complete
MGKKLIGIFGGSFDPPHKGHSIISSISIKKLKLNKLFWVITKKNPLKKKPFFKLANRLKKCKKVIKDNKKIELKYLDKTLKSSKTINILKYFRKKNKNAQFFIIIGADNLISFHLWNNWKQIVKLSKLVVFPRTGYDKKAKKSVIVNHLNKKNIIFIKTKRINISSSKIRRYYLN